METKRLTKKDFKEIEGRLTFDGPLDYNGHIEIESGLGWVLFTIGITATGCIIAEAGTGIEAGWGIEAGEGIKAGWGIKAGEGIVTFYRNGIVAKFVSCLRIAVGFNITQEQEIKAEVRKGKVILGKVVKP